MTEPIIICPKCKADIKLTESLAAPLIESTRLEYERRLSQKDADIARREEALAKAREQVDSEVAEKLRAERAKIAADESRKAKLALATEIDQKTQELAQLHEVLKQRDAKLAEAQKAQAELIRKQMELAEARREMDLTVAKRVQESLDTAREQARKEAEEQLKLKVAEKELTISGLQKQIDELKRRAEQGSMQIQGEAQEIVLEDLLRRKFPRDSFEPVPKGEPGADVKQRVTDTLGHVCGTILWESKRTKNWSDGWLSKLREDQRAAKADIAVLVSQNLPKGVDTFEHRDGIWITHPRTLLPVAETLRFALVEVAQVRKASEGQQTKMEMLYDYLMSSRFRQRVQAIVEAFSSMQEDLLKEKKVMMNQWAKREKQIENVIQSTVGMYGDLQGIAGKTLPAIDELELPSLEGPTADGTKRTLKSKE